MNVGERILRITSCYNGLAQKAMGGCENFTCGMASSLLGMMSCFLLGRFADVLDGVLNGHEAMSPITSCMSEVVTAWVGQHSVGL